MGSSRKNRDVEGGSASEMRSGSGSGGGWRKGSRGAESVGQAYKYRAQTRSSEEWNMQRLLSMLQLAAMQLYAPCACFSGLMMEVLREYARQDEGQL